MSFIRGRDTPPAPSLPNEAATSTGPLGAGSGLDLVGSTPIACADFGMRPPSVAGVASIRDHGEVEVRLRLRQAAGIRASRSRTIRAVAPQIRWSPT